MESFVNKSLLIEPVKNILFDISEPLEFALKFNPLRPFKTNIELFINKSSGGRWIYNVLLEATEPDIDDIITIESHIGRTTSVSFNLANQFKNFA